MAYSTYNTQFQNPFRAHERPYGFSDGDYADDNEIDQIIRSLGVEEIPVLPSANSSSGTQTNSLPDSFDWSYINGSAISASLASLVSITSNIIRDTFNDFEQAPCKLSLEDSSTSSALHTTSVSVAPHDSLEIDSDLDVMLERKRAAIKRHNEINLFGKNAIKWFEPHAEISTFNLDAILEGYAEDHSPRRLFELLDWAGIDDKTKRADFTAAILRCEEGGSYQDRLIGVLHDGGEQQRLIQTLLSKIFAYFEQNRTGYGLTQGKLTMEFRGVVDKIIDANKNCVDQLASQLQEIMLDIAVDAYMPTEGHTMLGKIRCRAGQELCVYKINLLKQICIRQNPNEEHMADLERLIMQRLADLLGLQGDIFNSGALYGFLISDAEGKINRVLDTFCQEYRPVEYLISQLSTGEGNLYKLRNELIEWAVKHYGIEAEDEANPKDTDVNPCLSADFDPDHFRDFSNGGAWTPAGALLLLEAAGLIRQA